LAQSGAWECAGGLDDLGDDGVIVFEGFLVSSQGQDDARVVIEELGNFAAAFL